MLAFVLAQATQVFFGNLHSHTSFSDGSGTPEQAYVHARDVANLDFLAITEHNHRDAEGSGETDPGPVPLHIARDATLYVGPRTDGLIPTASRINAQGGFVALYGQEFSSISKGNHVNVFEVGAVIDATQVANGNFAALVNTWLPAHLDSAGQPAILQFNHPSLHDNDTNEYGRDDFGGVPAWVAAVGAHAGLIEILNGPALSPGTGLEPAEVMEGDFLTYLNLGFYLAPTGDQDNHHRNWGDTTHARTAVLAPALTRTAILSALRGRRVYATEDRNLRLFPRIGGHLIGDRTTTLPAAGSEIAVQIEISDPDDADAAYRIDVFSDAAAGGAPASVVETAFLDAEGTTTISGGSFTGAGQYVFLRVTQTDENGNRDRAWTAPVWFEVGTVPTTVAVHIDSILPNPNGDDFQNEEATIHNVGSQPLSLVGWRLRDRTGSTWSLDSLGTLAPNQALTIRRRGQAMSMNNSGDETIELVSPTAGVVDEISYSGAASGQVILHNAM